MLSSLRKFSKDGVAKQRLKIMKFYDEYGEKAVREAFGADRKVISRWRKRLTKSGGKLESLIPYSTKPKQVRGVSYHQKVVDFIRELPGDSTHDRARKTGNVTC